MKFSIGRFKGVAPKIPPRFLPEDMAQEAVDVEAIGTSLKPSSGLGETVALSSVSDAKTIYKFGQDEPDPSQGWLAWDKDVDVVRSQIAGDEYEWTFFSGDEYPKAINKNRLSDPIPLGLPVPEQAPLVEALEYEFATEPAELYITYDTLQSFTVRFGLQVSLDGGKTYPIVVPLSEDATTEEITAEIVAAALNGKSGEDFEGNTQTLTAEVSSGGVKVTTSGGGRNVTIHIKYEEDDYTRKLSEGSDIEPPKVVIYASEITLMVGWGMDGDNHLRTHIYYNEDVAKWTRVWSPGECTASKLIDALNGSGLVTAYYDADEDGIVIEARPPHQGEWAVLTFHGLQQNRAGNLVAATARGKDATAAEVTLTLTDLAYLNSEDDILYSFDGGTTIETLPLSGSITHASVAAAFNTIPGVSAEASDSEVIISTDALGSAAMFGVGYKTSSGNILSATGATLDEMTKETRVYTYTWVSKVDGWERESAPSPPSESVDVYRDQLVRLTSPEDVPDDRNYCITHRRIYRAVNGVYLFLAETSVDVTTGDEATDAGSLGEEIPSLTWTPPPDDLHGVINLPNGMMAGFVGRDLYFCDPYHPHAWPVNYTQVVDYPVVGLGRMDTTLAVLTTGVPYIIQGSHPDSLVAVKSDLEQACVSKRSIVSMNGSVFYASPDGLMRLAPSGSELLTQGILSRDDWQALQPATIHAYDHDGQYVAFYDNRPGGFVLDTRTGDFFFHGRSGVTAAFADLQSDRLFTAAGTSLRPWGEGDGVVGSWHSKRFTLPQIMGFSCAQVEAESYPTSPPIVCKIFADGDEILSQVVTSRAPFRLPPVQARDWEIALTVPTEIFNVAIAQSMSEIARV